MLLLMASAAVAKGGNQSTGKLTTGSQELRAIEAGNPIPIVLLGRRATPVPGMPTGVTARLRTTTRLGVCGSVFWCCCGVGELGEGVNGAGVMIARAHAELG